MYPLSAARLVRKQPVPFNVFDMARTQDRTHELLIARHPLYIEFIFLLTAGVPTCVRDRASFCRNARVRLCQHAAYVRVCCKACQRLPKQRRRRQHRQKRRRFRHARRN